MVMCLLSISNILDSTPRMTSTNTYCKSKIKHIHIYMCVCINMCVFICMCANCQHYASDYVNND